MSVRRILKMGEPSLLEPSRQVVEFASPALLELLNDMHETMAHANGAGLAAPQIGVNWQVVVFGSDRPNVRYPDQEVVPKTVLINPTIEVLDEPSVSQELGWEGCLSVPGMRGLVPRHQQVRYSGFDQFGEPFSRVASGFHARVVQHECDHLWGVLYPMRMTDMSQFGFVDVLFPHLDPAQDD